METKLGVCYWYEGIGGGKSAEDCWPGSHNSIGLLLQYIKLLIYITLHQYVTVT